MRKTKLPIIYKCFVPIFKMLFDHLSFQIISKNSFVYLLQLEIPNHTGFIFLWNQTGCQPHASWEILYMFPNFHSRLLNGVKCVHCKVADSCYAVKSEVECGKLGWGREIESLGWLWRSHSAITTLKSSTLHIPGYWWIVSSFTPSP